MKSITSHSSLHPFGWCVVLLLSSTQSWGQEPVCISGNCVNGQGTLAGADVDGSEYVGGFRDELPNGQGTFTSVNRSQREGEWRNGAYNRLGTLTTPD